ncbi:uncharacterized protein LOC134316891 [Trichomycterus rosablanca]|uniref:uncharacterized protein LOC134316891 n=1 Tax=Trichomycterus rosablanca TaxID=2290929 RepID=UPI002F356E6E
MRVRETVLEEGDRVLVRNVGLRGKHKIADRWSQTVYKVLKRINDSPVYVVAPANSDGPERTLHRDLLLPCGFLAPSIEVEVTQHKPKKTAAQPTQSPAYEEGELLRDLCESEEEQVIDYVVPDITYPSITIVHEIPQTKTTSSVNPAPSGLRPEAEVFQPAACPQRGPSADESTDSSEDELKESESSVDVGELIADVEGEKEKTSLVEEENGSETVPEMEERVEQESVGNGNPDESSGREFEDSRVNDVQEREDMEDTGMRRSVRQRVEPNRLTYQTLGNPLTLVMQSLFRGLDQAFTKALDLTPVITSTPLDVGHLATV